MLTGKKVIVTGAARGLGRAFAEAAADAGAHVIVADILNTEGRATADAIADRGWKASFVSLDLLDPDAVQRCADESIEILGGLDGLVNNGAIATGIGGVAMEDIDIEVWDRVMSVNVRGTMLMTRACSAALRATGKGRVVNVASDTALWGAPALMHYVASKGAVISMTRAMARELGTDNVAVNAVAPGLTLVEATEYVPQERHDLYLAGRAIQRDQVPDDITGIVNFLLGDSAGFITGQVIPVNGGFVMN